MGGDGGYIRYHPDAILLNEDKAPTVVTSFSLWNKEVRPRHRIGKRVVLPRSILHSDRLRLRHNENSFLLFAAQLRIVEQQVRLPAGRVRQGVADDGRHAELRRLFEPLAGPVPLHGQGLQLRRDMERPHGADRGAHPAALVAELVGIPDLRGAGRRGDRRSLQPDAHQNETPLGTPARKTRTHEDRRTEPGQDAFLHQRIARIQNPAFAHPGPHREPRGTDPGQAPAGAALAHAAERRTAAAADRPDHGSAQVRQREDETQPQHGRVRLVRAQDLRIVRLSGATPGNRLRFRSLRTRAHLPVRQRQSREGAVQPAFQRLQVHARQRAYRHNGFAAPQRRRTVRRSRGVGHRDRRHGGRPGTYFREVLPGQQPVVRVDPGHGHRADAR